MSAVQAEELTKKFGDFTAVDHISFSVKEGEVFGFLGPNGAGKTTTIKAMLGLIHVNSGIIKIDGFDIKARGTEAKKNVGYLPEKVAFYDNLTALQNMYFYAEMKNASKE
ncbi:ATP-binding cassette domain-containing protein, partial [Candidatus Bathyarchaeota archaeon]|nr:ATP-binding cassette domain-containing protein [Candidatus Bathyarchaeota archaeon]